MGGGDRGGYGGFGGKVADVLAVAEIGELKFRCLGVGNVGGGSDGGGSDGGGAYAASFGWRCVCVGGVSDARMSCCSADAGEPRQRLLCLRCRRWHR